MAREGQSPAKKNLELVDPPNNITVCILVYVPEEKGYFEDLLEVIELGIHSLHENNQCEFDLIVYDNASCKNVQDRLLSMQRNGEIDYIIRSSRNIGQGNATYQLLKLAPGDYIFFSDGDIYFHENALESQLKIMQNFPKVGLVSGYPLRHTRDFYTDSVKRWLSEEPEGLSYEVGNLISPEILEEFMLSFGLDNREKFIPDIDDYKLTYQDVSAYMGAMHSQFLISKAVIQQFPHRRFNNAINGKRFEGGHFVDQQVDNLGYLRLSTTDPVIYHIGNKISENWLKEKYKKLVGKPSLLDRRFFSKLLSSR